MSFTKSTYTAYQDEQYSSSQPTLVSRTEEAVYSTLMPGLSYFPTSRLGLQFSLGQLQFGKTDTEHQNGNPSAGGPGHESQKSLTANFGFSQAALGINFFLPK